MADVHVGIPAGLEDAARKAAELPPHMSVQALIRLSLARLAGWPDAAALTVARQRGRGKR